MASIIISILLSATFSGIIVYAFLIKKLAIKSQQLDSLQTISQQNKLQYQETEKNLRALQQEIYKKEAEVEFYKKSLQQQQITQQEQQAKMLSQFENLSNKIYQEKANSLQKTSEQNIHQILQPLKEDILQFKNKLEDSNIRNAKERYSLEVELKKLLVLNEKLGKEANNLANAFKSNHKIQGNWGELILESILEKAGLMKGVQFQTQAFLKDETGCFVKDQDGHTLQPDVTLLFPQQRKLIIDSKVSLNNFELYINAEDPTEAKIAMQNHIKAIRNHVDDLSRKKYHHFAGSVAYTLMFMPMESALLEVLKTDPTLWEYAYRKEIIIVSPTNLLPVLKIIQELWTTDLQNQHAEKIAQQATSIYEKFVNFLQSFEDMGNSLNKAQESYKKAFGQIQNGKNSFSDQVEKLKKMGIASNKQIPLSFLPDSE